MTTAACVLAGSFDRSRHRHCGSHHRCDAFDAGKGKLVASAVALTTLVVMEMLRALCAPKIVPELGKKCGFEPIRTCVPRPIFEPKKVGTPQKLLNREK